MDNYAARLARNCFNAALPARVAADMVSKQSDWSTAWLFPAT